MKIDNRKIEDIEEKIGRLAHEYTPEWNYDTEDPDIGSTIARLFAVQMKENIDLENRMLEQYHAEFINMLDLSLKPAKPSGSIVQFDLIEGTISGTHIRKGTRLVTGEADLGGEQVIFETDREIYVTNSRLVDAFMTDREDATFVPLLGDYAPVPLIDGVEEVSEEESFEEQEEQETQTSVIKRLKPFVLFSESGNIARSAMALYHESLFDIEDEPIYIRFEGNDDFAGKLSGSEYRFRYYTKHGYSDFDSVRLLEDGQTIELKKHEENRHLIIGGRSYAVIIIEALDTIKANIELSGIGLSSSGLARPAEFVSDGSTDLDRSGFAPFSDVLSVYNECYIGHDTYFSKAGAKITVRFRTEYKDRGLYLTKQEEEAILKIIKKKPKVLPADIPADAYADEIGLEYFNGVGWRKLPCGKDISRIFAEPSAGEYEISFICPADWAATQAGAYNGRAIRMRLMRSDNCFLRPGVHHYPVISDLKVDFTYEGHFVDPSRFFSISGMQKKDITEKLKTGKPFIAMAGGDYSDDALYLGFNSRMESGPISIHFELDDVLNMSAIKCTYEYSSENGFKHLRVVDGTNDFSKSGDIVFMPPSEMHEMSVEGKRRFWIRIKRKHAGGGDEERRFLPRVRKIMLNVVSVSNIVTGTEENYYISEATPNQKIRLSTGNILDAEVWVNERDVITSEEIDSFVMERPDDIKVERDRLGNISAVYVRWTETDSFLNVADRRSYMIDRLTSELCFSDGIRADIPRITDDISFKVRTRSCDGENGNVPAFTINETAATELYIDNVSNPVRAYGGSNMETTAEALRRGANLIYGRGRLVSTSDYIFTILDFSNSIDKVGCIPGETVSGTGGPADISFVLLMKDFADGSFSFHRIAGPLKKHLTSISSMTISPDHIHIVEPIFVSISVTVWAELEDMNESFETQNLMTRTLYEYFNPVSTADSEGWQIGVIPKKSQIQMRLGTLKSKANIRNIAIIAHYVDKDGEHELDIGDLKESPFMVVHSGEHKVNIVYG
ncbi:MAG: hypothetical protein K6G42_02490 [Lachnospiraceae bacterium]|nr:hypothetical protein [Lachnospiraceae bacterium]